MSVGAADQVGSAEVMPQAELNGAVVIGARVLEKKVAARQIVQGVVYEILAALAFHVFGFQKNGFRQPALESHTPVEEPGRLERRSIHRKAGEDRGRLC